MIYPQITGEPNFILIGVSAVFGLLVIIIVYYIVVSKSSNARALYSPSVINRDTGTSSLTGAGSRAGAAGSGAAGAGAGAGATGSGAGAGTSMPVPINTGGYYATAPTATVSSSSPTLSNPNQKQVFNIKENIYAAEDASGVCGALGADVATIEQLVASHKQGANWCNVGWTKEGLAAYPIQYEFWQKMQQNEPQNRNICGQAGINLVRNDGGLLYGVNCYGVKPEPKKGEKVKEVVQSDADVALAAKIAQFQRNMNNITVVPFNANTWSV
jgi:hypothetical protein